MTGSAQNKTASTVTKLMTAAVAVLSIVLIVLTAMVWNEARRRASVDHTETAGVANPGHLFTYTLSLAESVKERCGETPTEALAAASATEKISDPVAYEQAVSEAEVRAGTITKAKSCDYVISEIKNAESRATASHR